MVVEYLEKDERIKSILGLVYEDKCPVVINDQVSWTTFPQYRDVYNRQKIAEYQKLYHSVMPVRPAPDRYPVVLKPIINLYGMGLNSYLLMNEDELWNHWADCGFWTQYLEGTHCSFDFIIKNGEILWHTCMVGQYLDSKCGKQLHGMFDSWDLQHQIKPPEIVFKYIKDTLNGYTGCLNVECIGDWMIEAHLRMGDLDQIPGDELLQAIIKLYVKGVWTLSSNYKPNQVSLFPIWGKRVIKSERMQKKIIKICEKNKLIYYLIEDGKLVHPPGDLIRLVMLTSPTYESGKKTQMEIRRMLKKHRYEVE